MVKTASCWHTHTCIVYLFNRYLCTQCKLHKHMHASFVTGSPSNFAVHRGNFLTDTIVALGSSSTSSYVHGTYTGPPNILTVSNGTLSFKYVRGDDGAVSGASAGELESVRGASM